MPQVEFDVETKAEPDAVRDALIDFGECRPEIWPGIAPDLYEVYSVGETSADVKEGSRIPLGAFWAKERYDWSDPQTVRWTVVESNFCSPGSFVSATLAPADGGGTRIRVHWERTGTTFLGRLIGRMIVLTKGGPVAGSLKKGLRRLERA